MSKRVKKSILKKIMKLIPSFVLKDLTKNVKMDHKKKFHKSLQIMQLFLSSDASTPLKQTLNLKGCTIVLKPFWFLRMVKQNLKQGTLVMV